VVAGSPHLLLHYHNSSRPSSVRHSLEWINWWGGVVGQGALVCQVGL
jgi:hypothetical protein